MTHIKLDSPARQVRERELVERKVRIPLSGRASIYDTPPGCTGAVLSTTPAFATQREATQAGREKAKAYEKSTWPSGHACVVATVEWEDGTFSSVVNTYYSFS